MWCLKWSTLVAPSSTQLTASFLRHHATASWLMVQSDKVMVALVASRTTQLLDGTPAVELISHNQHNNIRARVMTRNSVTQG